jgi:hypothetical protein
LTENKSKEKGPGTSLKPVTILIKKVFGGILGNCSVRFQFYMPIEKL